MAAASDSEHRRQVLMAVYGAFNGRDVESALVHMAPEVEWTAFLSGAPLHGREAVRANWQKQWAETDARVEPVRIEFTAGGARALVDQFIRDRKGAILLSGQAGNVYEFDGPFIKRMTIVEAAPDAGDDEDEE